MFTIQYHPDADIEVDQLPVAIRVKYDKLIEKLETDPRSLREPDSKPLGDGMFELRTLGNDIARGLWVYKKGQVIIMLRIFIKKTRKTPPAEIALAWKRLEELNK